MKEENLKGNLAISEKDLLDGCLRGENSYQKALYDQYKVLLFRVCLRYAKDRMEAEDMLQDGFIKIFDTEKYQMQKQYNTKVKSLFASDIHPESPQLFACGSGIGEVVIWDFKLKKVSTDN